MNLEDYLDKQVIDIVIEDWGLCCSNPQILPETKRGELTCHNCGQVFDFKILMQEITGFTDEERKRKIRSSPMRKRTGSRTTIGLPKERKVNKTYQRLEKYNRSENSNLSRNERMFNINMFYVISTRKYDLHDLVNL